MFKVGKLLLKTSSKQICIFFLLILVYFELRAAIVVVACSVKVQTNPLLSSALPKPLFQW